MIRRLVTPIVLVLLAVALASVATAHGGSTVTRPRLERSLTQVFANLHARQSEIVGQPSIPASSLQPRAMCDKHGPKVADVGAGGDWTCLMSWSDPKVPMPVEGWGKFELNVHSNDCYTATGPTKLIGFLTILDTHGNDVTNPLFEFDGCFDPHGDNSPTGVVFPSLLTVTSTALVVNANDKIVPTISCSLGQGGCAGIVTASAGGQTLGRARFDLEEGRTQSIEFPAPSAPDVVTLTIDAQTGKGAGPITLPASTR